MTQKHFQPRLTQTVPGILLCLLIALSFGGCQQDVVHQRSIAELNQKAQSMMQAGDYDGAISRLEAAHDLEPDEPNTTYNLAVAYQTKGEYEKAIGIFSQLLQKPGPEGSPMSAAQIHRDLGITYEAQADKLEADAKALMEKPKADATKAQQLTQQSNSALQSAMEHYKQALPGVKDPDALNAQIQAIETKLKKNNLGAQP